MAECKVLSEKLADLHREVLVMGECLLIARQYGNLNPLQTRFQRFIAQWKDEKFEPCGDCPEELAERARIDDSWASQMRDFALPLPMDTEEALRQEEFARKERDRIFRGIFGVKEPEIMPIPPHSQRFLDINRAIREAGEKHTGSGCSCPPIGAPGVVGSIGCSDSPRPTGPPGWWSWKIHGITDNGSPLTIDHLIAFYKSCEPLPCGTAEHPHLELMLPHGRSGVCMKCGAVLPKDPSEPPAGV